MEDTLTRDLMDMARSYGACSVGVATTRTLAGGPPSADLTYVLPEAESAVSFAVALDQDLIEPWFAKTAYRPHFENNLRANVTASGISLELASYLRQKGHPSVPLAANNAYRDETPHGRYDEKPLLSHRYLAVRSGVGFFGLSGNVLTSRAGAAVILGSMVTAAKLAPSEPIPAAENYCDECRLCVAGCASGFFDEKEKVTVTLGGIPFSYSRRRHHNRCDYVCGGFTGLHPSGRWSTWSPGRFPVPDKDEEFLPALRSAVKPYLQRPKTDIHIMNVIMPGERVELTCGNCQLICHPDKEVRRGRFQRLTRSGVIIQNPDGSREALPPEEARRRLAAMLPEVRRRYERD